MWSVFGGVKDRFGLFFVMCIKGLIGEIEVC